MNAHVHPIIPAEPLPHNIEAEQALLGALLVNNDALYRVEDLILVEDFFEPIHGMIYDVIRRLVQGGQKVTPIVLKSHVPDQMVGTMSLGHYIARLAAEATTVIHAPDYAKTVRELSRRRGLVLLANDLKAAALGNDNSSVDLIQRAEEELLSLIGSEGSKGGFLTFETAVTASLDMAAAAYQRDGGLSGIATGLRDLDAKMGGLQKSDLIILGGRPGAGKTSLATNIAYHVASQYESQTRDDGTQEAIKGGKVAFFSLEMSAEQLATRILSDRSGVSSSNIRRGEITETDFYRLQGEAQKIARLNLHIEESGGLTIAQLMSRARRQKKQRGMDLMIVDYIQLLSGGTRYSGNRVQEITEITTGLKALAKELNVPVLALSQLSRGVEQRDNKRPQLSDLRESGSIEQDADVVMFVYREEYYLAQQEPPPGSTQHGEWHAKLMAAEGKAEINIGKQRHGPTGTIDVQFDARTTRFSDLSPAAYLPQRMGD